MSYDFQMLPPPPFFPYPPEVLETLENPLYMDAEDSKLWEEVWGVGGHFGNLPKNEMRLQLLLPHSWFLFLVDLCVVCVQVYVCVCVFHFPAMYCMFVNLLLKQVFVCFT